MKKKEITTNTVISQIEEIVTTDIDGETVMMGCNTKKLHRLSCQRQVPDCIVIKHISYYPQSFSASIFELTCQD